MKNVSKNLALLSLVTFSLNCLSYTGAVIDSGTDFRHEKLSGSRWYNISEMVNNLDDDNDKLVDDISGWNFAEKNNLIFDPSYVVSDQNYVILKKYFSLQDKFIRGTITEDEYLLLRAISKFHEKDLEIFGNFAHGTHVAGIMTKGNIQSKILALKILPTVTEEVVKESLKELKRFNLTEEAKKDEAKAKKNKLIGGALKKFVMKFIINKLASIKAKELKDYALYMKKADARVANCSWGSSYENLETAVKSIGLEVIGQELPAYDVEYYTQRLLRKLNNKGERMIDHSGNTLFVFAAGNDGDDTDFKPSYPSNMDASNVITVAATTDNNELPAFSNYGVKSVDVAAPGVGILSTSPQQEVIMMTGTSQAAPYVSQIGMKMVEINSRLKARDLRRILMETVDRKDFLVGKVASSGVVNAKRALRAAELSLKHTIRKSLKLANNEIPQEENAPSKPKKGLAKLFDKIFIHKLSGLFR